MIQWRVVERKKDKNGGPDKWLPIITGAPEDDARRTAAARRLAGHDAKVQRREVPEVEIPWDDVDEEELQDAEDRPDDADGEA